MKYIALDIGSSSIKGTVRDLERLQMASQVIRAPCPDPVNGLAPRHCELDPMKVAESVQRVLDQRLTEVSEVAGMVSCNQMADVVLAACHRQRVGRH